MTITPKGKGPIHQGTILKRLPSELERNKAYLTVTTMVSEIGGL